MSLDHECCENLMTVMPRFAAIFRHALARANIPFSLPQYRILEELAKKDSSITELADHHGKSLPGTSKLVDGLVRKGLVRRVHDLGDRRKILLSATRQGRKRASEIDSLLTRNILIKLASLTESEKHRLQEGLAVLREILK